MRVTRSASRRAANGEVDSANSSLNKRALEPDTKTEAASGVSSSPAKKQRKGRQAATSTSATTRKSPQDTNEIARPQPVNTSGEVSFLPAALTFSFDEAKDHLVRVDPRFEDLFTKLKCRPFEHLERIDPFRTLTTSILGQQISWLAARSITHKFIRLFDPSLPEKPQPSSSSNPFTFFPSAHQVSSMDIPTLRTAGLSQRKAEYVQDLASRFADGRLSNEKIMEAEDEQLYEMLVAVRGIGKWTVDMFAIFSLRRPDILPVGDLGVQRGLVRWILSLHSPKHSFAISPKKLPKSDTDNEPTESQQSADVNINSVDVEDKLSLPPRATTPDASAFPPAPLPVTPKKVRKTSKDGQSPDDEIPMPPPVFTPSINRTLNKVMPAQYTPSPLPEGLTVAELQRRIEGKKIKGAFLTAKEMEDLTEAWRPYRSLGVFYMWALSEGNKS